MITTIFFKEKPLRTLVSLADNEKVWYASMLCKETDCTYPHMLKILGMFEKEGLVRAEGQGRIRIVRLTEKGEDLATEVKALLRRIEKLEGGKE